MTGIDPGHPTANLEWFAGNGESARGGGYTDSSCADVRMDENGREDFVSVEPLTDSVRLLSEQPGGATAMVVFPRDQAVEVSRQILRSVWDSSSHAKRLRIIALLLLMVLTVLIGSHLAGEALPV